MDADLHRAHADLDERHWWFVGRRRIITAVLERHVSGDVGAVLDIGCGAGGLLPMLRRHGRVTAVEGEQSAATIAKARHPDAEVIHGSIPEALAPLAKAGLVTAFDVIEHLDDDVGTLRVMADHLTPDGTVCVTVPACPWLWSSHDTANGHRRRYSMTSLRAALADAGLDVVHISYFNTLLFPLVATARLLERIRGPKNGGDFAIGAGPLDRVLQRLFASERAVVSRWRVPFGVSLVAVARPAHSR